MAHSRVLNGPDKIHAALRKLKDQSNAQELELIELVANIYEKVKETQDKAIETVKDTANNVNTSVHLHPWYYIGGAVVAGVVAGIFMRR